VRAVMMPGLLFILQARHVVNYGEKVGLSCVGSYWEACRSVRDGYDAEVCCTALESATSFYLIGVASKGSG
jgi:hypothetical protein